MENIIDRCKDIIDNQIEEGYIKNLGIPFDGVQKAYFWSNENINDYLNLSDFNGKDRALTVAASGDHIFSLITNGVTNIDTFDINRFTEYFALGLKIALIRKYDYEEFLIIMNKLINPLISLDELTTILIEVLPFMEKKYCKFWRKIINYNYSAQKNINNPLNLIYLLCIYVKDVDQRIFGLNYLSSKENYNVLRNNLSKANINFYYANAVNLGDTFQGKYDFILLSNILDYFNKMWGYSWKYDILREYIKNLEKITRDGGTIYLKYIMKYASDRFTMSGLFISSGVKLDDLKSEEVHKFPSLTKNLYDGMILKRK